MSHAQSSSYNPFDDLNDSTGHSPAQAAFVAVFPSFDEVQSSPKAGAQSERLRAGSVSPLPKTASAAETAQDILALPTVFPAGSRPSLKELQTAIEELTKRNSAIQALNDTLEKDLAAVRVRLLGVYVAWRAHRLAGGQAVHGGAARTAQGVMAVMVMMMCVQQGF